MARHQQQRIAYLAAGAAPSVKVKDLLSALVGVTSALDYGIVERNAQADLETRAGLATAARLVAEELARQLR
jgi:hypothetical protein